MQLLSRLYHHAIEMAVVLVLMCMPVASLGESVALDDETSDPLNYSSVGESVTIGHPFEVSVPFRVTGLGVFDLNFDGIDASHDVAIWSYTKNEQTGELVSWDLVVSPATVTPGGDEWASASPLGQFVVQPIPNVVLDPGNYIIAGFFEANFDAGLGFGPYVTTLGVTRSSNDTYMVRSTELEFPQPSFPGLRTFVTFTGMIETVPEPSFFVLMSVGLLFILRRRSR